MKVNQVAIVSATHGNEPSGTYLYHKWQAQPALIARNSFQTETLLANLQALDRNTRYVDGDLNRQFAMDDLANIQLGNYEQSRAKALNAYLGPKGEARVDFIIDLHNTTSQMGATLVIMQSDEFHLQLAGYVAQKMPDAHILIQDNKTLSEHYFLCTVAKKSALIEVGAQPQGVLRQDIAEKMESMTHHVLDFIEKYNENDLSDVPEFVTGYRYVQTLSLPQTRDGKLNGMIHSQLQDNDFKVLKNGDPLFTLFDGSTVTWQGDDDLYPHFINEAAYYDQLLAMSLGKKVTLATGVNKT